jgi:arsenite methyltransferase
VSDQTAEIGFSLHDVAGHYDELPLWSAPFGQLILDRVPLRAGQTILDVGSGTGFLTVELAQRSGSTSRVIAVDPWHAAMDILRDKCRYLGLANVYFSEADAKALDRPDGSVDVIVSNLGINNFDDPTSVLTECRRVLRRGGTLLMTSNLVGHMAEFYEIYRETLLALDRADRLAALDEEISHRATVNSATTQLAEAGFNVGEVVTTSFLMRFADGTSLLRHYFIRLGFLPGWRTVVEPVNVPLVFSELERRLNERASALGGLELSIPAACFVATPR